MPDKTKEQLLNDLSKSKNEVRDLKNPEERQRSIDNALNLEHELYADLANALPSGIYRLRVFKDVSLVENNWLSPNEIPYVFEFANNRFFEILHLEKHVFEKNPGILHDLIFEADKAEFARINVESNLHKTSFSWEGRLLIDDKVIWIHFKSVPRMLENNDIIWTGTLEDITKRKQSEEEIILKNAELQKLNADKDIFMSILAHDLISPFNSILGYLDLLSDNLHDYDISIIEEKIHIIKNSALSTFYLLEDILLWARSQSIKLQFEPKEFNFNTICDSVVKFLEPIANTKNIKINVIETEKTVLFADINMLNTILRNLISNAIKFTNSGGNINIYANQIDSMVIISVEDNGIGISPDILAKLFNTTQIYSSKGTANEKGTGLGLLLCKEFVEKHRGKIWVESEFGVGSKFKFSLSLKIPGQ